MGLRHLIAICAPLGSGRWKMEEAQMPTVDSAVFKNNTSWAGLKAFGVVILLSDRILWIKIERDYFL
jgi:hypothetical protein